MFGRFYDVGPLVLTFKSGKWYSYVVFPQQDKCSHCGRPTTQCYSACTETYPFTDEEFDAWERALRAWG